ncbi:MAG: hypothetical protein KAR40_09670 [Candidatus Sabulitectum sp.]|nr:hypothetical protein [Candidatus Sabulitectum sp.]
MANQQLTIDMITREALRILVNMLSFTKHANREYDKSFAVSGAKIGDTLRIRKPSRYIGRSGNTLSTEDHVEKSTELVLDTLFGVDAEWTSKEMTLEMDDFAQRHLLPAMATIANKIDYDGLGQYKNVGNQVGTPGTTPATSLIVLQVGQRLSEEACPKDQLRTLVVNPDTEATIVDALKGIFNPAGTISEQFTTGNMGRALGFKWSMDQNVRQHTTGTHTTSSTPLVNGASQSGESLITDGWQASTAVLKAGDIITIADVNAINPQNRDLTGSGVRQFTVTEDVTSDGAGNATLSIAPPIFADTHQFATVDNLPANDAALTMTGTEDTAYPINMAFHRDAFVLGTADLIVPEGTHSAHVENHEGISMRIVQDFDIVNNKFITRIDVLYGWATVYQELACRLIG